MVFPEEREALVFREQAELALSVGDVAAAKRALGLALAVNPLDAEASAMMGEILLAGDDIAAAKKVLIAALARNPSHDGFFDRLISLLPESAPVDRAAPVRGRLAALSDALERDQSDDLHESLLRHHFAHSATAWDVFCACMMERWAEAGGGIGTVRAIGLATGQLRSDHVAAVQAGFDALPEKDMRALDAAPGWLWDDNEYKVKFSDAKLIHRQPDAAYLALLEDMLRDQAPAIEQALGCWFRISALRIFSMRTRAALAWHYDGWPTSMCKLYLYPDGADPEIGTTLLRGHDGIERPVILPPGGWALFEASACSHTGSPPQEGLRRAIEFACVPAPRTDVSLRYVGTNAAFPWSPFEGLPTQVASPRLSGQTVGARLKRRALEDACGATRRQCNEPPDGW